MTDFSAASSLAWLLVGAPLLEETVFRLGLHQALLTRGAGFSLSRRLLANLAVAVAFALAHWLVRPGWWSAATVLPAIAIGVVYDRYRRLWPCVAGHAAFNLLGRLLGV